MHYDSKMVDESILYSLGSSYAVWDKGVVAGIGFFIASIHIVCADIYPVVFGNDDLHLRIVLS